MRSDPLYFWKRYELVGTSGKYIAINTKSSVCRYCGKTNLETTFSQETHLLPQLLGSNKILTFDECDSCNKLFSDYESNLSIFIRPYITLLGIKGRKSVPDFQSRTVDRDEKTRTTLKHNDKNKNHLYIQDVNDYSINTTNRTFEILFRKPPYVPLKVYKSLLKIGLSLLPTEFDVFNQTSFNWLTNKQVDLHFIRSAFIISLKRKYFSKPSADLYRAKKLFSKNQEFPEHILVLNFSNQVIQIFLPFSREFEKIHSPQRNLELNLFPSFIFDKLEETNTIQLKIHDLGISHSIIEDHQIAFSYQSADLNIPS